MLVYLIFEFATPGPLKRGDLSRGSLTPKALSQATSQKHRYLSPGGDGNPPGFRHSGSIGKGATRKAKTRQVNEALR